MRAIITKVLVQLDDVSIEDLWRLLDVIDESVPTQRILAAIAVKRGDSTSQLAARHNVSQQTICNWLGRFDNQPLEEVPYDDPRSGKPWKLSEEEYERLIAELQDSPESVGFDRQAWFHRLVYHYIQSEYDVEYSSRHIRRVMREAELSWRTARPTHYEGDPEQAAEFQDTIQKTHSN